MDNREKLEADIRQWLDSRLIGNEVFETVISWLDRQAAIMERECIDQHIADQIGSIWKGEKARKLQAKIDELTEERDGLQDQLAEIENTHMRLPVDADGVPIRLGDTVTVGGGEIHVGAVGIGGFNSAPLFCARDAHHVKPDTVEGIIAEAMSFACEPEAPYSENSKYVKQYAERIRKAVEQWQH